MENVPENIRNESRPAGGAWIETKDHCQGERGNRCRAPHGARGLKQNDVFTPQDVNEVAPRRGRVD